MPRPFYARWRALVRESLDLLHPGWRRYLEFAAYIQNLGPKPSEDHRLFRLPNPHGRYEPGNFGWGTPAEYQRALEREPERLGCQLLTIGEVTKPISRWAEETGVAPGTIQERLRKGYPADRAVMKGILRDGPVAPVPAPAQPSQQAGEQNGRAKLTNQEVQQARDLFEYGYSFKELAQMFKVEYPTIYNAIRGFKWRHLVDKTISS